MSCPPDGRPAKPRAYDQGAPAIPTGIVQLAVSYWIGFEHIPPPITIVFYQPIQVPSCLKFNTTNGGVKGRVKADRCFTGMCFPGLEEMKVGIKLGNSSWKG